MCPGRFFADDSLWAAAAVILSTFRFEKAKDAFGKEIEVEPVFRHGVVRRVRSFCQFGYCQLTGRN
ncbi:hypothetical protein EDD16DRAFT_1578902 [Pisolithus croceorrhizus]|nr:hypothetical protein EDD16DRAFT_1578902 [Pisolithus croceorrhizus]